MQEIIIGADFLELGKRGQQGTVIPQAHVAKRRIVLANIVEREVLNGGKTLLLKTIERIRLASELNGARNVGPLLVDFIGSHHKALHDFRIERAPQNSHRDHRANGEQRRANASTGRTDEKDSGGQNRHDEQRPQHGHRGVNIRVARAVHQSARRIEEIEHPQAKAVGDEQKEDSAQRHQVRARRGCQHGASRREPDAPFRDVHERGGEQAADERHQRQVIEKPGERKLKEVEAEVASKERIDDSHVRHVPRPQIGEPMPHAPLADHVSAKEHATPDQPAEERTEPLERLELNLLGVNPSALAMRQRVGDQQIQSRDCHEAQAGDSAEVDLGFQDGHIDLAVALLIEPEPIQQ